MSIEKGELRGIDFGTWLSQDNLRSLYFFRASAEDLRFFRGYTEIFCAYVALKWSIQARSAYALLSGRANDSVHTVEDVGFCTFFSPSPRAYMDACDLVKDVY